MRTWTRDPHSGGAKIPNALQDATRARLLAQAQKHYAATCARLDSHVHSHFCYIDAYHEPDSKAGTLLGARSSLPANLAGQMAGMDAVYLAKTRSPTVAASPSYGAGHPPIALRCIHDAALGE
jgi:hypothetical protein